LLTRLVVHTKIVAGFEADDEDAPNRPIILSVVREQRMAHETTRVLRTRFAWRPAVSSELLELNLNDWLAGYCAEERTLAAGGSVSEIKGNAWLAGYGQGRCLGQLVWHEPK
jgi:hypothetical protein